MRSIIATYILIAVALLLSSNRADAFITSTLLSSTKKAETASQKTTARFGYVPDGFTQESYAKFKADEKKSKKSSNLGRVGPRGFESRSMRSFQEALEMGETSHLLPVPNWKDQLAKGQIRREDIPYMQRGGTWDNSDVKGAKNRKRWLNSDKEYAADESKKQNSFSILGWGEGLDWTGTQRPGAGPAAQFGRNYKAPNVRQMKKDDDTASGSTTNQTIKKKLFGIF